ncbi:unnamed protein product [Amoebophrya sp. A120]|nr:unnamed protein product [Amoebophrya sp. A120]|eukprot:GSA120T00024844001.1
MFCARRLLAEVSMTDRPPDRAKNFHFSPSRITFRVSLHRKSNPAVPLAVHPITRS